MGENNAQSFHEYRILFSHLHFFVAIDARQGGRISNLVPSSKALNIDMCVLCSSTRVKEI
jgi:hypothetical protein